MATLGVLKRKLTTKECPWLGRDLEKGKEVYEYSGCTYGCIGRGGIAVTDIPEQTPFYEVPEDSVDWNNKK